MAPLPVWASPGSLLEMQNLWLYPDGWNQKLWGWDAVICCVTSLPGDFDALVISLGRGELGGLTLPFLR